MDEDQNRRRLERQFQSTSSEDYGTSVRARVFEAIVLQGMAGAPWREVCCRAMQMVSLTPEEIETEINRRKGGGGSAEAPVVKKPKPSSGAGEISLPLPPPEPEKET